MRFQLDHDLAIHDCSRSPSRLPRLLAGGGLALLHARRGRKRRCLGSRLCLVGLRLTLLAVASLLTLRHGKSPSLLKCRGESPWLGNPAPLDVPGQRRHSRFCRRFFDAASRQSGLAILAKTPRGRLSSPSPGGHAAKQWPSYCSALWLPALMIASAVSEVLFLSRALSLLFICRSRQASFMALSMSSSVSRVSPAGFWMNGDIGSSSFAGGSASCLSVLGAWSGTADDDATCAHSSG